MSQPPLHSHDPYSPPRRSATCNWQAQVASPAVVALWHAGAILHSLHWRAARRVPR